MQAWQGGVEENWGEGGRKREGGGGGLWGKKGVTRGLVVGGKRGMWRGGEMDGGVGCLLQERGSVREIVSSAPIGR